MCRLIPAYVEEKAWLNLVGDFEMGMEVTARVYKVCFGPSLKPAYKLTAVLVIIGLLLGLEVASIRKLI